jgi:hypothetical protein
MTTLIELELRLGTHGRDLPSSDLLIVDSDQPPILDLQK